ncbi:MAG: FAD-binding oxidoreductase, partial [Rhodospirillales bacterium]|nr:FAD-binding oxidoreductase [Rhodospirillales bacterium]
YGNARDLALGLEVVLPSGDIWENLKGLRKDNTGYDLKHLFIGAEGTLGVITGAVLKLFPYPHGRETAMVALPSAEAALSLFVQLRAVGGDNLTAFEIINQMAMSLVTTHIPGAKSPFADAHAYYALIELSSPRSNDDLRAIMESCFAPALESGIIDDAVLSENTGQSANLWRLRESIPEAQVAEGASIKHDISVPVSRIPKFITLANEHITKALPETRIVNFGHMGDGNLHYNLTVPVNYDAQTFLDQWDTFNRLVHDIAMGMGGSFSAEHGLGQLKRGELERYGSPVTISMMRTIKSALDPYGIMNPGKVIPDQPS